jgi:hypothetical protein
MVWVVSLLGPGVSRHSWAGGCGGPYHFILSWAALAVAFGALLIYAGA